MQVAPLFKMIQLLSAHSQDLKKTFELVFPTFRVSHFFALDLCIE